MRAARKRSCFFAAAGSALKIGAQPKTSAHRPDTKRITCGLEKTAKEFSLRKTYDLRQATPWLPLPGEKQMALKDIIVATQADLRANADHAVATFSADSRQVEGLRSEAKIRQFS
jgi:hypothetical protein